MNASVFAAARLNSDGSLDTTFDGDGRQTISFGGGNDQAYGATIRRDGKAVIVGTSRIKLQYAELDVSGALDSTFSGDGTTTVTATDVANSMDVATGTSAVVQNDGKILFAGQTNGFFSGDAFMFGRLNTDGTLDQSFGDNAGWWIPSILRAVIMQQRSTFKKMAKSFILAPPGQIPRYPWQDQHSLWGV